MWILGKLGWAEVATTSGNATGVNVRIREVLQRNEKAVILLKPSIVYIKTIIAYR